MKLISMTDFVIRLNQNKNYVDDDGNMPFYNTAINHYQNSNRSEDYRCIIRYANFLKQPLKLEMFVSDDKEKVLFEYNPEFSTWDNTDMENQNIEDLLTDDIEYFLTTNATKQFLK